MLNILRQQVESLLPVLLQDESQWHGLYVNYHPPIVERLWMQWDNYRICLHRIFPCGSEEALFHSHPWPSAMKILSGRYEMAIGYGKSEEPPPVAALLVLTPGCYYEMTDPDAWHYVRPLDEPAMSLMVSGKPWERLSPSGGTLQPLNKGQRQQIIDFFRERYRAQS